MPEIPTSKEPTAQVGAKRKIARKWWVISVLIVGSLCFFAIRGFLPGGDAIIARATAADGTEMCVVQYYNSDPGEPYTVSFYYRKPGKPWGWFYYGHEDTRWFSGKIVFDASGNLARIYRGNSEVARFDATTESFTINRWNRTLSPAQQLMPDDWKPEDILHSSRLSAKSPVSRGAPDNSPPGYQWK